MRSRIAVALFAALAAGGLAHAQSTPAPAAAAPAVPVVGSTPAATPMLSEPPPGGDVFGGCGCCNDFDDGHICGPRGRFWAEADAQFWWMKGGPLPPLVTSSPVGTAASQAGNLSVPGTSTLFGNNAPNEQERFGGTITVGAWLDCNQTLGIEASFMTMEKLATNFSISSAQNPIFAVPIINAQTNLADSVIASFPGLISGRLSATETTSGLTGGDLLAREVLLCGCNYRVDVLGGYRYLAFSDHLSILGNETNEGLASPATLPIGSSFTIQDHFDTTNEFNGFDFGLQGEYRHDWFRLRWLTKVAVGANYEQINVHGGTAITSGGPVGVVSNGGVLAQLTNSGDFSRTRAILIPECGLQLGAQLTPHIRTWVGYSGLYWTEAVWAGKQVDTSLNRTQLGTNTAPALSVLRPIPLFGGSSLWAEGIDVGLEVRY